MYMPGYKTSVRKYADHTWIVSYYMPYSGLMYAYQPTWHEAMKEAWAVEKGKAWM